MNMINLLPLKQNVCLAQIKQIQKTLSLGLCFVLLIMLAFAFYYKIASHKLNHKIYNIETQKTQQNQAKNEAVHLQAQNKLISVKINEINTAWDDNKNLSGFLNLLPKAMPDGLYLVNLSWHEHTGIIYGQATHNKAVTLFLDALKNNDYFEEVSLIKSDKRHEIDNTPPIYFMINFYNHD